MPRSANSLDFEKAWSDLRAEGELIPPRSALRPVDFKEYLPTMGIVEIDTERHTMPIRLAGTAIRDFVGFELTGQNFLDYDAEGERGWAWRLKYHEHPCGRYEELLVSFRQDLKIECALTILPLIGPENGRLVVVLFEPIAPEQSILNTDPAILTEIPTHAESIDIGAGVPDLSTIPD